MLLIVRHDRKEGSAFIYNTSCIPNCQSTMYNLRLVTNPILTNSTCAIVAKLAKFYKVSHTDWSLNTLSPGAKFKHAQTCLTAMIYWKIMSQIVKCLFHGSSYYWSSTYRRSSSFYVWQFTYEKVNTTYSTVYVVFELPPFATQLAIGRKSRCHWLAITAKIQWSTVH